MFRTIETCKCRHRQNGTYHGHKGSLEEFPNQQGVEDQQDQSGQDATYPGIDYQRVVVQDNGQVCLHIAVDMQAEFAVL